MGMNHALPVITFDYFNFLTQKSPPRPHTHTQQNPKKGKKIDTQGSPCEISRLFCITETKQGHLLLEIPNFRAIQQALSPDYLWLAQQIHF